MVHQGQRLAFGLEPGDDLLRVHARLDDLERDLAPDRAGLLGHVDDAHAAFADLLQQLVRADHHVEALDMGSSKVGRSGRIRQVELAIGLSVGLEEHPHSATEVGVFTAGSVQEGVPPLGRAVLDGFKEDGFHPIARYAHFGTPRQLMSPCNAKKCRGSSHVF